MHRDRSQDHANYLSHDRHCAVVWSCHQGESAMKAVVITRFGGPDVLEIQDVPKPEPGPEEIVIHVRSTALNRADLLQRAGRYAAPPGAPQNIPGLEFAGE